MSVQTASVRRYERKIRITRLETEFVRQMIWQHPALLTELYPPRYINNLYLDTLTLAYFRDHLNGVPARKKVRIRWYGDIETDRLEPSLELKSKVGWVTTKPTYKLEETSFKELTRPGGVARLVARSNCAHYVPELVAPLQPVLLNRYRREYYRTADAKVRVTLDRELKFYSLDRSTYECRESFTDAAVIVEIKYDEHAVVEGKAVAEHFPLPLTKHSKYVFGIEQLCAGL